MQGRARRDASRAGAGGGSGLLRQGRCAGLEVLLPERELTYQLAAGVSGFESTRFAGAAFAQQLRPGPKLAPSGAGLAKPRSEPPQVEQRIRQVEGEVQEMRQEAAALAPYARLAGMQTQRTKLKRLADQPAFLRLPTIASTAHPTSEESIAQKLLTPESFGNQISPTRSHKRGLGRLECRNTGKCKKLLCKSISEAGLLDNCNKV